MITTIITTYRRPHFLKRAVNSVLKQTYEDFQVQVYDNASNDETEEIVQKFLEKDSRVKYHRHPENIGMMENYRFAFERIETPYFSLLSDDDFLLPNFYETALKGFEEFPDAAFSACGVVQMNESGRFLGNPLSLWQREGHYPATEGMLEMIRKRCMYPIPTGVLFQHKIVKNIKPDYNKEIQFFWDPDYLLRIAIQFSCVITKKTCAVYFAHFNAFSNSFYSNMFTNFENIETYMQAAKKILIKIEENTYLTASLKQKAKKVFRRTLSKEMIFFLKVYITSQKYRGAHMMAKSFYLYHGSKINIFFVYFYVFLLKGFSLFKKIVRKLIAWTPMGSRKASPDSQVDLEELKTFHEYGQTLF